MKKQGRNFVVLVAVLAVLAAGYFLLVQYNKDQQERESNQTEGEVLVDLDREDILRFSYVYDGETYVFEKAEVTVVSQESESEAQSGDDAKSDIEPAEAQVESCWVSTADRSLNLMQNRLESMAGKFTRIIAQNVITDVTDLSLYGLEEPSNTLHWETAQENYTYDVGDYNSFGNVYYICEPGSHTVYAVTASLGTGFGYSLEELVREEADGTE